MTSLGEVAELLGQARALAAEALSRVREAEELWLNAAADLTRVLVGSETAEAGELARPDDEVRRRFTYLGEGPGPRERGQHRVGRLLHRRPQPSLRDAGWS